MVREAKHSRSRRIPFALPDVGLSKASPFNVLGGFQNAVRERNFLFKIAVE
jgi:hypothetical protein